MEIENKIRELANKIDLPTMFETYEQINKIVNELPLTDEQKKAINDKFDEIQKQIKDLGND